MLQARRRLDKHPVADNSTIVPWYVAYGPLFESLMGKRYNLRAHAVTVSEGVANAFIAPDGSHIYPVALVKGSSATLELRGVPANVTGFEASFPGAAAGTWAKVKSASKQGSGWRVQVAFADSRASHAALVRSVV